MLVTLIGKKSIHKLTLPNYVVGNYWISERNEDSQNNLINIEGVEGRWQVQSDNLVKIIDPKYVDIQNERIGIINSNKKTLEKITLTEYSTYCIEIGKTQDIYILYCSPVYEKSYKGYNIRQLKNITIGSDTNCHIEYDNALLADKHAVIYLNNGRWKIKNYDQKYGTYINDTLVEKNEEFLFNGDVIFIMGLKIIFMGNYVVVNNPLNRVKVKLEETLRNFNEDKEYNLKNDDENIELYSEKDYFYRAPRITQKIKTEKIDLDSPPSMQEKETMPAFLFLGSTLTMGLVMMISMVQSISGYAKGQDSKKEIIFTIIISITMLIGIMLFPILEVKYEKKQKKKYEKKRQQKYREYINNRVKDINKTMIKQKEILLENFVSEEECSKIILNKTSRLWERRIEDFDFLTVKIGMGEVPVDIDIEYPKQQFTLEEDNLVDMVNSVIDKSKVIKNAPVTISLTENRISGIIGKDKEKLQKFMQSIILQLITFHSYEDLRLVFFVKEENRKMWEYVKMLPHVWNNTKDVRFYAENLDEMKDIAQYMEEDLKGRMRYLQSNSEISYTNFLPYYLIITDDYRNIEKLKLFSEMLNSSTNIGFSVLSIAENLMQLPNECRTFIDLSNEVGTIFESEFSEKSQRDFIFDESVTVFFDKIIETIANLPIKYTASRQAHLPSNYNFLEMYNVGLIEQLNALERWKKNDSTMSLKAPIGIDSYGVPIILDIHEKFHGPHGLIAGSTGSGKSEFIITYILSLAINYHPDDVNFILIDYKGGGLAGAFQKREVKLPHLVGTITNIDTAGLQRSLASIQSELRRRQIMFNEARNKIDEGTIDIYKYQKLYHEGVVEEPIPHLLIICDEFAELKQQQEDFMDELISVARIGRSLGVHLILATQKPAGIVNDQIRSNSRFAVCLKVQDTEDSVDVIKRPDAANLKNPGRFYMQVGNDEYFILGQSAWSGASYIPSSIIKKKIDTSIQIISNTGIPIKAVDDVVSANANSNGEQLTNIVKYLYEIAQKENIHTKPLWLENIPENIYINDIRKKYRIKDKKNHIDPVIGEYDDPFNQNQGVASLKLSDMGNTIIYGSADSGKETLLSTIIYDIITTHTPEEVQLYLLDFGSEVLKIFKNAPHVGDVVFIDNNEKINRFFEMIQKEIQYRKSILSDFGGDYTLYKESHEEEMPMIICILNNYESFNEIYEDKYEDIILSATREGIKCGIIFVITTSSVTDMRYRLSQNFKQKITLQLNNDDDYSYIFDKAGKKRPSSIFGRGLISIDDNIYEFQTAKVHEPINWNQFILEEIDKLQKKYETKAKRVPTMPNKILLKDIKNEIKSIEDMPIGISKESLEIYKYNFERNFITRIISKNLDDSAAFILNVIEEFKLIKDVETVILDAERIYQTKKTNLGNDFYLAIKNNPKKKKVIFIIGIDKFINELEMDEDEFSNTIEKLNELDNYRIIAIDTETRYKNHQYDRWNQEYSREDCGIWVGNGIEDQYTIATSQNNLQNNCGYSYGYVVNNGKATLIKLLGMKEKGDDNE